MNWDQVKGDWKQYSCRAKEKWGRLTDKDLDTVAGKRDKLAGILQQRYGYAKETAEKELDEFARGLERHVAPIETTYVRHESHAESREDLVALLNEDLAGEYQAIISYVIYSKVIKGAQYMNIAAELEKHAAEELAHALIIAEQIDDLGGMPVTVPNPVKTSANAEDMLRFDLKNENDTIARYRQRVRQCEALGEYAVAEHIREILIQEQDHQIALATALGEEVSHVREPINVPGEMSGQGRAD